LTAESSQIVGNAGKHTLFFSHCSASAKSATRHAESEVVQEQVQQLQSQQQSQQQQQQQAPSAAGTGGSGQHKRKDGNQFFSRPDALKRHLENEICRKRA
jgi:small-conductance mechanosensitive channel